jgi:adenylate cyclase
MSNKLFKRFRVSSGIIFINVFFIVLTATVILSAMWVSSAKNALALSELLIEEIQGSISGQTRNFFEAAEILNQDAAFMVRQYFDEPVTDQEDQNNLLAYFDAAMRICPQSKMIYYADDKGNFFMNDRMTDGSISQFFAYNDGTTIHAQWNHTNNGYYSVWPNTDLPVDVGYDARTAFWDQNAVASKEMIWTPVYLLDEDNQPGFSCVIPIFNTDGTLHGITGIDITSEELSRFLGTLHPTENTKIVLIDNERQLVAFQAQTEADLHRFVQESTDDQGNKAYSLKTFDAVLEGPERYILQELLQTHSPQEVAAGPRQSQSIRYNGETFRAELFPLAIGNGLDLCVIIPEEDILGDAKRSLISITAFSLALLALIILISALLSHAIAKPLQNLAGEMEKIQRFDLDSTAPIGSTPLIEIATMQDSFEGMKQGLKNFKHYVPSELVAQLIDEKVEAKIGGEKREMTMFFSDIAKFTSISEQTEPEKLVDALCTYFETVSKIILDDRGTIDKYIGDSVMAFWGAPTPIPNHAELACRSAVKIQWLLHAIFRKWENTGKLPFYTRIGLNTGEVLVGNMGYNERLNYTVIGDQVNLASRLEGANKVYGTNILTSRSTYERCKDTFEFRHIDRIAVVGRQEGIDIYELYAEKDDVEKQVRDMFRDYETALNYYFEQNWDKALHHFGEVLKVRPADIPTAVMQNRCLQYQKSPPPPDWQGVFSLASK